MRRPALRTAFAFAGGALQALFSLNKALSSPYASPTSVFLTAPRNSTPWRSHLQGRHAMRAALFVVFAPVSVQGLDAGPTRHRVKPAHRQHPPGLINALMQPDIRGDMHAKAQILKNLLSGDPCAELMHAHIMRRVSVMTRLRLGERIASNTAITATDTTAIIRMYSVIAWAR